ncbi:hypothetical protein DS745_17830 [Anaerobacillus alkaliphilus]|uniref:Aminoglycoside phosphotransferase domain-containing protein n=1 Tax=Anaerobacillus alkaliphilus TaxID=1548597 RepID=A0A4Q0VPM7_9BACI|nr:phosphotransferase [Anaerobacillus alkaliphilus]RXI98198.1 hypothetical protein DS745_17830 [Anaerobacillus alkaliphilus]
MMPNENVYTDSNGNRILRKDIEMICEEHQIGRLIKVVGSPNNGNINGIIFVQTAKGKYVIRSLSIYTTKERIVYLENVLRALKNVGVPVLRSIKTQGNDYYSKKGGKFIQVYPYVAGHKFMFLKQQIEANAKMLSKFHQTLASFEQGPLPDVFIYPNLRNLTNKIQTLTIGNNALPSKTVSKIVSLYSSIEKQWERINPKDLPKTIIHDDWHPWNMVYKANGSVAAILDYDYFQQGERIYDIAYVLYYLNKRVIGGNLKQTRLFLRSYGELIDIEKAILPIVIAKVALFNILFATNNKSEDKLNRILHVNEELINRLLNKGLLGS